MVLHSAAQQHHREKDMPNIDDYAVAYGLSALAAALASVQKGLEIHRAPRPSAALSRWKRTHPWFTGHMACKTNASYKL